MALGAAIAILSAMGCEPPPVEVVVVGADRPVSMRLPNGGAAPDAPLLVVLHPYGVEPEETLAYSDLEAAADQLGFLMVAPSGLRDSSGQRFWNGGPGCCDFDETDVDDAAYIAELIGAVGALRPKLDNRVVVMGFENGGFLSYQIGCRFGAAVGAIVSIGGMAPFASTECAAEGTASVLHVHGDADPFIFYDGAPSYPSARASAALFARLRSCSPLPVPVSRLDLDDEIAGDETLIGEFPACEIASVALWTAEGVGRLRELTPGFATRVLSSVAAKWAKQAASH